MSNVEFDKVGNYDDESIKSDFKGVELWWVESGVSVCLDFEQPNGDLIGWANFDQMVKEMIDRQRSDEDCVQDFRKMALAFRKYAEMFDEAANCG